MKNETKKRSFNDRFQKRLTTLYDLQSPRNHLRNVSKPLSVLKLTKQKIEVVISIIIDYCIVLRFFLKKGWRQLPGDYIAKWTLSKTLIGLDDFNNNLWELAYWLITFLFAFDCLRNPLFYTKNTSPRLAEVHLSVLAGSTFPVPVCTVPSSMERTSRCNNASYRLNLLLLKRQICLTLMT